MHDLPPKVIPFGTLLPEEYFLRCFLLSNLDKNSGMTCVNK